MLLGKANHRPEICGLIALLSVVLLWAPGAGLCGFQATGARWSILPSGAILRGIELASRGHCDEALPIVQRAIPGISDKQLLHDAALAGAQCGMTLDRENTVAEDLIVLNRNFPNDPKVLYITTRYYSELANRTAHKLLRIAPSSAEAGELLAEALQSRGRLDEAADEYRKILAKYPNQSGIHYMLGRIILAKSMTPAVAASARKEFEAELKINPASSATEFMLGEIDWRMHNLDQAIEHFSKAVKDDASFAQGYLGLGIAYNAAGKYADAVKPLEQYVRIESSDPAGHYQLAIAYARTGHKEESARQLVLLRETTASKTKNGVPTTAQDMMQPH
jgi:tetratricopeptide (TPR) repeat protein